MATRTVGVEAAAAMAGAATATTEAATTATTTEATPATPGADTTVEAVAIAAKEFASPSNADNAIMDAVASFYTAMLQRATLVIEEARTTPREVQEQAPLAGRGRKTATA